MALKIAIASGKGGTGKTTVSVNLFRLLSENSTDRVMLVDCDVEEPNAVLFFPGAVKEMSREVNQEIPVIDTAKCTFCRKCNEYCEFNAILVIPPVEFAEINPSLCHSCGACMVACDQEAIWVKDKQIGTINTYSNGVGNGIMEGNLKIGSAMQTMVIRTLKQSLPPNNDILLFDAPPGTSCPVVETISDTDYVILVTEPTPFGLHDLKLMVNLVRELNIPFGVVINKANLGDRKVYEYLHEEKIDMIGEIPFNRSYAVLYAKGEIFADVPGEIEESYRKLIQNLTEKASVS
ncbi:MAG: ATP-binding protein [Bacteroidota bacterium]